MRTAQFFRIVAIVLIILIIVCFAVWFKYYGNKPIDCVEAQKDWNKNNFGCFCIKDSSGNYTDIMECAYNVSAT